jgi:Tellurite resistance protein and related permeases
VVIDGWFAGSTPLEQVTPVWFIPTVGNIVIPIGAVAVGESILGWVGFSIGLILWLALLPIVVFRLIHAAPLPPENEASQLVLVAPPAIGSVAWVTLTGGDQLILGVMLLAVASFWALTLVPMMARVMLRSFSPANWSFGFPLAALASGLVLYADALDLMVLAYAGLFVLVSVSLIVMWLLIASARILVKT